MFISRKDDIIVSSGYRVRPSEIEDTLIKHPAVLEAAVIGIPDEERGQIPKAFVILRSGHEPSEALKRDLQEFVKKRLAKYEYPRMIGFISQLPKTTTGRIKRKVSERQKVLPLDRRRGGFPQNLKLKRRG